MRRSTQVAAPLLALAASAMIAGCRKPEMQRCVDEHNVVVDDKLCQAQQGIQNGQQQRQPDGHGGFIPIILPYHYYYGGYGGYGLGSVVGGGSYMPSSGHSYATSSGARSGTVRGGFGSTHGGSGGGAGE
ncbi:hypothetical protein SAMN05421771_0917 [Granulicella pectinivorans]|jgi:hypothetical protein|uniref:Uncharacterized protein n=1 Tax=Granulicella pectinivorans TaxID=474950 RepID=A0A1I6LLI7_9BACT|nr:hypothetical protein [Granulicella pectinivorans]SFS04427.1 hypothetical protein SAMN05421771_0917 [Granulicella pectinivorans]